MELDETTNHVERQGKIAEYLREVTFVSWLLLAAIVGEGAALAAIVSHNPRFIYFVLVVVAISFLLMSLAGTVLAQAESRLDEHEGKKGAVSYMLITVGLVIFLLLIFTATVL